jgi:hydroxyacyl-ACP dehydratase HTD2-like protein with hotdog domain
MLELRTWIGCREVVEDEIGLTAVRRIAATLALERARLVAGSPLPPHRFSLFFPNNAMQRDIDPDGHANKGVFPPPIPLSRMGAGCRAKVMGRLVAGEPARRVAEVVATGFAARLTRPLWVGDPLTVCGAAARDQRMPCWGAGKEGYHSAAVLEWAA